MSSTNIEIVHVADETVAGRRSGIVGPEFISMGEAVKNPSAYESWSRFWLENLDALLSKAAASGVTKAERVIA